VITLLAIVAWPVLFLYIMSTLGLSPYLSWLVSGSIVTFAVYVLDKLSAKSNLWRIREEALHLMSLLGGFAGAALGLVVAQHKFRKGIFIAVILLSALLHFGLISGVAAINGW
jgi:uncharacterized membrane protein YsdA (DUF1294 family)